MSKKTKLLALSLACTVVGTGLLAGCGGKGTSSGKQEIGISIYNGGHGTAWATTLAEKFMQEHPEYNEKYEIVFYPEKKNEQER